MPTVPYILQLSATLGGNGTGTLTHTVPRGETLSLRQFRFNSSGNFNITDIRDSAGNSFTQASTANAIPSAVLQDGGNANRGITEFMPDLVLAGSATVYFDLVDTSGSSNTIQFTLQGTRDF